MIRVIGVVDMGSYSWAGGGGGGGVDGVVCRRWVMAEGLIGSFVGSGVGGGWCLTYRRQ